jgi:poly(hydroxyalkanoate) depolymerase family esterase
MNRLADEHGFLTLYPRQGGKFNPYQCWNWFDVASQRGHGEAAIIAGMVSHVVDSYAVDPRRVYVVGMSSGGAMASILASCYAKLFAAAAIHSGLPYQAASTPWTAFRAMREGMHTPPEEAGRKAFRRSGLNGAAMPVVVLHGDADDVVHIVNAEQVIVQFAWMNHYSTNDGTAHPVLLAPARVTEARVLGGWRYTVKEYWRKGEVLLLLYVMEDMGHAWSGGDPGYRFNDPRGPDASRLIWEFFRRHRR